ncbi:hypothetical protein [Paraburkholderia aromaticivorans]|uniref:hypothetical protein n=1 Tax=Paraburkholderia aromaticivorans TaxID=2026199 RepID=UPI001455FCC6|nr:hypothetical protein [Paraburkholderia aromaticivorans]
MRYTKQEAAERQLNTSIRLFFEGDYLSSLTLAGAAEEIFGKLSLRAGLPVALDEVAEFHRGDTDPALTDKQHRTLIADILNKARNQAKHANDPLETELDVSEWEPAYLLMRAVPMAQKLGVTDTDEMKAFAVWVQQHQDGPP